MRMFYGLRLCAYVVFYVRNELRAITSPVQQSASLSLIEPGTNLSRLFEQSQLRYKPSKNVPRKTP
jgi:hypothetical protein